MAAGQYLIVWLIATSLVLLTNAPVLSNADDVSVPPVATAAQTVLNDRVARLTDLTRRTPVIKLNGALFRDLVRSPPRNYSVFVMLTALNSRRGCSICRAAADEYEAVAASWRISGAYNQDPTKMYFSLADFDDAGDVFQALNLQTAPVFLHFPPSNTKQKPQDTLNIQVTGYEAEVIGKWVHERTGVQIRVVRKPNYLGVTLLALSMCFCAGLIYYRRSSFEFVFNRDIYAFFVVVFICYFLSGQMWNHMRGPPFMSRNPQSGQVVYIHGSTQGQYVLETYIVMALELATAAGFILLIRAPQPGATQANKGRNRVYAIAGLCMVTLFFSLLLSTFRSKFQGYPYSFLLR